MTSTRGFCPGCDSAGPIGEPCENALCRSNYFGFLPGEQYSAFKDQPMGFGDKVIGRLVDEYLPIEQLGKGAFGVVYLALQRPLLMKSALKLMPATIPKGLSEKSLTRRYLTEATALARIDHPNVIRLLKYGETQNRPYLALEYVSGRRTLLADLQAVEEKKEPFNLERSWHILEQLLLALEAIHTCGVIHLDVRPDNVMLQNIVGDRDFVRVFDFGLSVFQDEEKPTTTCGAAEFLAPEQLRGNEIGPYTDLYAAGLIACRMLTGYRPYAGRTVDDVLERKEDDSFEPAEKLGRLGYQKSVVDFFAQALAPASEDRFQTAHRFISALNRVFDDLE